MPSDYAKIRDKDPKELLRRAGETIASLYSKSTHFIFELLQNAEDQKATRLEFRLLPDRLEVIHDGEIFDEKDVAGICDYDAGNKAKDLTKIGKFGIGFKSVYAYTETPEIHSGDDHFRIEDYVRPHAIEPRTLDSGFTTLFVLPFREKDAQGIAARAKIKHALQSLNPSTLLFLRSIESVVVKSHDGTHIQLSRKLIDRSAEHVRHVRMEISGTTGSPEDWLVFEKPHQLRAEDGRNVSAHVEIAFHLEPTKNQQLRIAPTKSSPLVVFFLTEKPTNMGFLIQGPYRTTPARDNVPEDEPTNSELVHATGDLIVEALLYLKTSNQLTTTVLETLPINKDSFTEESMFRPIYDKVRDALQNRDLLPIASTANDRTAYASGYTVRVAGSAELRKLISPTQLSQLSDSKNKLNWLSAEITERLTPQLWQYLRHDLKIEEIDPEALVRRLTLDFMAAQPDEWTSDLYCFLAGQRGWLSNLRDGLWQAVPYLSKPIIRLESGQHVTPMKTDGAVSAFLPPEGNTSFPCVRRAVIQKKEAKEFLESLGYSIPDESDDIIHNLLPKYKQGKLPNPQEYQQDLERIFAAFSAGGPKKETLTNHLRVLPFIKAVNAANSTTNGLKPSQVYFDTPELLAYFDGNPEAWFVSNDLNQYRESLKMLGVAETVRVFVSKHPSQDGHVWIRNFKGNNARGLHGFDPKCKIDGLAYCINQPTAQRSAIIWNTLLAGHPIRILGTVQECPRQDFPTDRTTTTDHFSEIGHLLRSQKWVPQKDGTFIQPQKASLDALPPEFKKDAAVARALGMKTTSVATLAQEAGIPPQIVEFFQTHPDAHGQFEQFRSWQQRENNKPRRPQAASRNPSLREQRVTEQTERSAPVERQVRERTIRANWNTQQEARAALRELNTNEDGQMICQICCDIMPFTLDDGAYYFDAVECLKGLNRELPQNRIALCPICSAKYQNANGTSSEELVQRVLQATSLEVPLTLARELCSISFTELHLSDLQTALRTLRAPPVDLSGSGSDAAPTSQT